MTATLATESAR